jgi:endogenous inhibitor of DNA gyrase (YacG/DUF329 family)
VIRFIGSEDGISAAERMNAVTTNGVEITRARRPRRARSGRLHLMSTIRCPICGKQFEAEESSAMPFCSRRCHQIDLQHWLDEQYGLPFEREKEPEQPADDDSDS